jgi:hypothetical protein
MLSLLRVSTSENIILRPNTVYNNRSMRRHHSLPTTILDFGVPSERRSSWRCNEHISRIADLEGWLSLLKCQAKTSMDQAGKSLVC